jgi:hypothetical protein
MTWCVSCKETRCKKRSLYQEKIMKMNRLFTSPRSIDFVFLIGLMIVPVSVTARDQQTLGYGTAGIAAQVEDPELGSIYEFGMPKGTRPNGLETYRPGRVSVAGDNPTGLSTRQMNGWRLGYGTRGIARRVEHPGLGSLSMFGNPDQGGK